MDLVVWIPVEVELVWQLASHRHHSPVLSFLAMISCNEMLLLGSLAVEGYWSQVRGQKGHAM